MHVLGSSAKAPGNEYPDGAQKIVWTVTPPVIAGPP